MEDSRASGSAFIQDNAGQSRHRQLTQPELLRGYHHPAFFIKKLRQHPQAAGAYPRAGHVNEGRLFLQQGQASIKSLIGKCRPEAHHRAAKTCQVKTFKMSAVSCWWAMFLVTTSARGLSLCVQNLAGYPAGISRCSMKIDQGAMALCMRLLVICDAFVFNNLSGSFDGP